MNRLIQSCCVLGKGLIGLTFLFATAASTAADGSERRIESRLESRIVLSEDERQWIAQRHEIRIRVGENPPEQFIQDNIPSGLSVDYVQIICRLYQLNCTFVPFLGGSFPDAIRNAGTDKGPDLLLTGRRTSEREQYVRFTREYLHTPSVILTREESPKVFSLSGLAGKKIAVERGYVIRDRLAADVPNAEFLEVGSSAAALKAVATGAADAYVGNLTTSVFIASASGLSNLQIAAPTNYELQGESMMVRKDWPELVSLIYKALSAFSPAEQQELQSYWYSLKPKNESAQVFAMGAGASLLLMLALVIIYFMTLRRFSPPSGQQQPLGVAAAGEAAPGPPAALKNRLLWLGQFMLPRPLDAAPAAHEVQALLDELRPVSAFSSRLSQHIFIYLCISLGALATFFYSYTGLMFWDREGAGLKVFLPVPFGLLLLLTGLYCHRKDNVPEVLVWVVVVALQAGLMVGMAINGVIALPFALLFVVLFHVIQRPNAALISSFSVAALVLIAVTFMFSPEDTALGLRVLTQALILLVIMRIFSLVFVRLTENTRSLLALLDEKTKTLEGHLTRAKITDQRLSVLNRKGFSQYLEQQLAQTVSSAGHYELIFIRAYHLYASPRIFSPEEEDIYYGSLVDRLRQFVSLDTEIGRVGQFDLAVAVFLPSTGKSRQPLDVHAMQRRLSEPVLINGKKMSPDIRLGMVTITDPGEPVAQWMEWASMALLESLKERKTPVSFFDQSMLDQVRFGELIRGSLPAAFDRREFQVVYQPIVDLHDGKLVRAEALVRWAHPELGLIGPDTFISLVESEHMMYQLTRLVFEEVSRARDHWLHTLGENIQVGVNVSASTLESPEQIYKLAAIFNPSGIKGAQGIVFEITESLFLAAIDTTKDVILKLRDQGFSFALDDFGVGYSSLSYLSQFKLDYLKIDRSFVDQIENDKDKQAIVKAVVDVAHALSMRVVAEGIENQEQRDLLLALNCDLGQGYLFSKPLTSDDFQSLLQSQTSQ